MGRSRCWAGVLGVSLAAALSGCDDGALPPGARSPEEVHCRAALTWLNKGVARFAVREAKVWDVDDTRHVTLRFDQYPLDSKQEEVRDMLLCRYPLPPRAARGQRRGVTARELLLHAMPLSERQVEAINTTISLMGKAGGEL